MKKELSVAEALKRAGFKENPNIPNVAIFISKKPKKKKKSNTF